MGLYTLSRRDQATANIRRAADLAWSITGKSLYIRHQTQQPIDGCIPDVSEHYALHKTEVAREILSLLDRVSSEDLCHDDAITAKLTSFFASWWIKSSDQYWICNDILGLSLFIGPFDQTAYTGGLVYKLIADSLQAFEFNVRSDVDRYLALVSDTARMSRQIAARTQGQAERGIRIHKAQIPASRQLLRGIRESVDRKFRVQRHRFNRLVGDSELAGEIDSRIDRELIPTIDALIEQLDGAYEMASPIGVGLDKLPGGRQIYDELATFHTTLPLDADEIHRLGLQRMARIESSMAEIRAELEFQGGREEFHEYLRSLPEACATDADDIGSRMRRHRDRVEEKYDRFFSISPKTGCDVARLDPALEGSMTWGYYQAPGPGQEDGLYLYNGSKLNSQAVISAASVVFHELIPGHHLHLDIQSNNEKLHPFRRYAFVNAFNEGWAEYAASLADEMDLYVSPIDKYGRLLMDAFLTSRLVVDTGMNCKNWDLDKAHQYISDHTLCTSEEISTDLLRYSCGVPGQSLAYKLGDEAIFAIRDSASKSLGADFDIKDFHSAILETGGLPLEILRWHIQWCVERNVPTNSADRHADS